MNEPETCQAFGAEGMVQKGVAVFPAYIRV